MALLDATLRARASSLASYLQVSRVAIPAGATVGIGPIRDVVASVHDAVSAGIRRVKLKYAPDADVVAVQEVRSEFPAVDLVVDAYGSYSLADPSHRMSCAALDELGLAAIEQPLEPGDLAGHAQLVSEFETMILLDESVSNLEDLDRALDAGACTGVCVKPGRLPRRHLGVTYGAATDASPLACPVRSGGCSKRGSGSVPRRSSWGRSMLSTLGATSDRVRATSRRTSPHHTT